MLYFSRCFFLYGFLLPVSWIDLKRDSISFPSESESFSYTCLHEYLCFLPLLTVISYRLVERSSLCILLLLFFVMLFRTYTKNFLEGLIRRLCHFKHSLVRRS